MRFPQIVPEAVHDRRFGADNDKSDTFVLTERDHLRMITYIRWPGLRDGEDATIARRTIKSFELRALPQFPGQCVFAATAADKKHIHAHFLA